MSDQTHANDIDTVVRSLALKAVGLTGADIERVVREARRTARREKRELVYNDIAARLESGKPKRSEESQWRRAIHEAGHAVARYHLRQGSVDTITINGPSGRSYIEGSLDIDSLEMEDAYAATMISILAGRAAEEVVLGKPSLGSGGSDQSDLAKATEVAVALETNLGTSQLHPLVHVTTLYPVDQTITINTGEAVSKRLEEAYRKSLELVKHFRPQLIQISEKLVKNETLESDDIAEYVAALGKKSQRS